MRSSNLRLQNVPSPIRGSAGLSERVIGGDSDGVSSYDAGVGDKHYFSVSIKHLSKLKQFTINFKNRFHEGRCEVLSNQPDRLK